MSAPQSDGEGEAALAAYVEACRELQDAIHSLESALIAFTGKEEGIKNQVFARTRERLDAEVSAGGFPWTVPGRGGGAAPIGRRQQK